MTGCLAMYDLSGIQSFIFQTNKLKEIVGASYLVNKALFCNVAELLGEEANAWKTRPKVEFDSLCENEGKTVYVGGGNALVLFGGKNRATEFTRALKRRVFCQTGGALRICSALYDVDEDTRLDDCLDPAKPMSLRARLERSKAKAPQALPARGFSIDALDNLTGEPIVYFSKRLNVDGEWHRFMSRSQYLKLRAYEEQRTGGASANQGPLVELMGDREYQVDADKFFGEEEHGKHFLAIMHIDGNTMGQRITEFTTSLRQRHTNLAEDLVAMRDFSAFIGTLYKDALKQTIDVVYGDVQGTLPFRPVVADGDDITFICRSDKAFACLGAFMDPLHNPAIGVPEGRGLPDPKELSVGAGIALVRSGYPFSSGYALAEELCKNAKKAALDRFGKYPAGPVSGVDFHVCSGEVITSIADFRRRRLVQAGVSDEEVKLCMRPYHMADVSVVAQPEYRLDSFLQQLDDLLRHSGDDEEPDGTDTWIARSKLKMLREKYGEGEEQAKRCGKLILEREMTMHGKEIKQDDARRVFIEGFRDPYAPLGVSDNGKQCKAARYFDALDIMDLCEGFSEVTQDE